MEVIDAFGYAAESFGEAYLEQSERSRLGPQLVRNAALLIPFIDMWSDLGVQEAAQLRTPLLVVRVQIGRRQPCAVEIECHGVRTRWVGAEQLSLRRPDRCGGLSSGRL